MLEYVLIIVNAYLFISTKGLSFKPKAKRMVFLGIAKDGKFIQEGE